jgi:4-hydroxy-3-methylbut-2-en-1-yl diphosphate synthase IspG/GcpE
VTVGDVTIGSDHPIRIQTMTTTDTKDVAGTVEQVTQLFVCFALIAQASSHFTMLCQFTI